MSATPSVTPSPSGAQIVEIVEAVKRELILHLQHDEAHGRGPMTLVEAAEFIEELDSQGFAFHYVGSKGPHKDDE